MTDLRLGVDGDLLLENGSVKIIDSLEELTRQRLLIKLRTFTKTLFTNVNFGVDQDLLFKKNTKSLLDQEIKTLIEETEGVLTLKSFTSKTSKERTYSCDFEYSVTTGEIVSVTSLTFGSTGSLTKVGVWEGSQFEYLGTWANDELWGS